MKRRCTADIIWKKACFIISTIEGAQLERKRSKNLKLKQSSRRDRSTAIEKNRRNASYSKYSPLVVRSKY